MRTFSLIAIAVAIGLIVPDTTFGQRSSIHSWRPNANRTGGIYTSTNNPPTAVFNRSYGGAYIYPYATPYYGAGYYSGPHFYDGPAVYGYSAYGPYGYGYSPPPSPIVSGYPPPALYTGPVINGPNPFNNAAIQEALRENDQRWKAPLDFKEEKRAKRPPVASTAEAKLRSVRLQQHGDNWMRKKEYGTAMRRYRDAIAAANDRAEPYFRIGYAYVALGMPDQAVKYFKEGLTLDPEWPRRGRSLAEVYGVDHRLTKSIFRQEVAEWVRDDIRDSDRLFLMGVMLHFDGDAERAEPFFEAAYRLAGDGDHLVAFLAEEKPGLNGPELVAPQVGPDVAPGVPPEPQP